MGWISSKEFIANARFVGDRGDILHDPQGLSTVVRSVDSSLGKVVNKLELVHLQVCAPVGVVWRCG